MSGSKKREQLTGKGCVLISVYCACLGVLNIVILFSCVSINQYSGIQNLAYKGDFICLSYFIVVSATSINNKISSALGYESS